MVSFYITLFLLTAFFKALMVPAYHSTDFEVHRNWMAVTSSLPWYDWYTAWTPSEWTLDYPPLFAVFEYGLSFPARIIDPNMTRVDNLEYASWKTVWFQRMSVVACDALLMYAIVRYWKGANFMDLRLGSKAREGARNGLVCVTFLQPTLFMVDHVHFQYNGGMFGLFVLSAAMMQEGRYIQGAFLYAVLLMFKHLFLYMAPAYFFFLLKHYCWTQKGYGGVLVRIAALGITVLSVFSAVLGPFIAKGRIVDLVSRLFPWDRGLCHALWAPNAYVPYNILDRVLCKVLKRFPDCDSIGVSAKGILRRQEYSHAHLPNVTPLVTNVLVVLSMLGPLFGVMSSSRVSHPSTHPRDRCVEFLQMCVLSCTSFFLFGWHIHEKAILSIIIPLCLLLGRTSHSFELYTLLTVVAHITVMPLVYSPLEQPMVMALIAAYLVLLLCVSSTFQSEPCFPNNRGMKAYLLGLGAVGVFTSMSHTFEVKSFLPLLMTSAMGCVGVCVFWVMACFRFGVGWEYPLLYLFSLVFLACVGAGHEIALGRLYS